MALDRRRFGERGEGGAIVSSPEVCAITGKPVAPGDVTVQAPGTPYFVKVKAAAWRKLGEVERDEMRLTWRRQSSRSVTPVEYPPEEEMEDIPEEG